MKFIVTAGGQGTKIWPMSRETKPKQFQNIVGDKSLYQYQITTLLKAYSPKDIYISTKQSYVKFILEQSPEIPLENIIIEPEYKKNRGPGEGLAFLKLSVLHPNEPFMIIQSDCVREPYERFLDMISEAEKLQIKDRKYITGGQKALYPVMGIDYIELGSKVESQKEIEIFRINKFVERLKTEDETKVLIENFHISTHSNHSCWFPELMMDAYSKYRPDWYEALMKIKDTFGKSNEKELIDQIYSSMEEGSTEEVTKHVMPEGYLILLPFRWTDVGTWNSVYEYYNKGNNSNYKDGNVLDIDSNGSVIKGKNDKLIAVIGINDLVIIDTEDTLLVCPKNRSNDIKKILDHLSNNLDLSKYL